MGKVLIADDEAKLARVVTEALVRDGHECRFVTGGREAISELEREKFDLVLTDLRMPEVDGLAVLKAARAQPHRPEVLLMTAYASTESAVEALREGAADYIIKPFAFDELRLRVRRLTESRLTEVRANRLMERLMPELVAESPAMRRVLEAAKRAATADVSVLITGPTGTGKSQLARFIHLNSARADGPLQEVQCAALPETLLESELFGHEKGSFTGAHERREGHLAASDGGTLFLDEIGEVSLSTQVKLLRFLQEREFVPVGANRSQKVNTRVIAATNRDLTAAVKAGSFREDFFYRLNVFTLEVPPLNQRREDLTRLVERLLAAHGLPVSKLSPGAVSWIHEHSWPGNVRELENAMERAVILAGPDPILAEHFRPMNASAVIPGGRTDAHQAAMNLLGDGFNLDNFERTLLEAALERTNGNKAAAARLLGITRRRLYSRLQSLGEHSRGAEPPDEN